MEQRRKLLKDEEVLIPAELRNFFELFEKAGKEIYLVGAGVRNILTSKTPVNCDLTTNAKPEETLLITKEFESFYENDFGMVGVPVGEEVYEITTFRTENGYSDFRRPDSVTWGKTLGEDVIRRDFTMNAVVIGKNANGFELIDLVDGVKDFENGLIRAVGIADERFKEDALRMLRAVRFAATLGFQIEKETLAAIGTNSELLAHVSRERIRDEFLKILGSKFCSDGVRMLIGTGLMKNIIAEVVEAKGIQQNGRHQLDVMDHMIESLKECPSSNPIVRLATFIHDIGKPKSRRLRCKNCKSQIKEPVWIDSMIVCQKCGYSMTEKQATTFYGHEVIGAKMAADIADELRLSAKEKNKLVTMVRWHMFTYQPEMTDASIRRFIRRVGKENVNDMILLRIGDRKGGGSKSTSWRLMEMQKRIGEQLFEPMEINDMVVNGKDVMEILGINPGPKVGKILKALFEEVLEDTSKNTRDYLLGRIKELN